MRIAICENESIQVGLLNTLIIDWANKKNINVSVDNFESAESFLFQWSDYDKYDVIFLDIKLGKMSGIELSNIIREKSKKIDIVFITGFIKYALHGYKVGALQYLIKPVSKDDLYFCLDKTFERINNNDEINKIIIKTTKKSIKLDNDDIQYCVMFSPYLDIHTKNGKISLRKKISEIEDLLPSEYFIRCHRSYIVNIKYVKSITKNDVLLENGDIIPISRGNYKKLNDIFIDYIS